MDRNTKKQAPNGKPSGGSQPSMEAADCVLNNLHKTSRVLDRVYAEQMRPAGLGRSQYTILSTLAHVGPCSVSAFADRLQLERTTLTRNLYPLEQEGLVTRTVSCDDGRRVLLALTIKGERRFAAAQRYWRQAQDKVLTAFGKQRWNKLQAELLALRQLQGL